MRNEKLIKHPLILHNVKACGVSVPPMSSTFCTAAVMILGLSLSEILGRVALFQIKHLSPVLENATNRYILARHLGVDTLSCLICALLGWCYGRPFLTNVWKAACGDRKAFPAAGAQARGFTYQPAPYFMCVWFLAYQLKNMVDTIVWNDGPEYIFHHALSLAVCWTALYPGYALDYAAFFFGISEVSTAVICVLANFDPDHGAEGLAEAFPVTKMVVGVVFVVLFIICRVILWPIYSYYYTRDALANLKNAKTIPECTPARKWVIRIHMTCLVGLSVLQLFFLVLIYIHAKEEFKDMF